MTDLKIQLKSAKLMVFVLQVEEQVMGTLTDYIDQKFVQSPQFFKNALLVIDLSNVRLSRSPIDFELFIEHCQKLGIEPIGFKGVNKELMQELEGIRLAKNIDFENQKMIDLLGEKQSSDLNDAPSQFNVPKVVTRPVRSGQQVYAQGCDLYISASVSEGAEVLADGNIFVRGTLRGRAFAGIKGFEQAQIFCDQLKAEIVSIAGHFMLADSLPEELLNEPAQIYLQGDKVVANKL